MTFQNYESHCNMTTLIQWNKAPSTLHNDRTIYESMNLTVSCESTVTGLNMKGTLSTIMLLKQKQTCVIVNDLIEHPSKRKKTIKK